MNVFVKAQNGKIFSYSDVKVIDLTDKGCVEIYKDCYDRFHHHYQDSEVVKLNRADVVSIQYYVWMKSYTIKVSSRTRTKMVSEMPDGTVLVTN